MGSSWNFPARASPSYESSELSRAELGHFNFRAETELTKRISLGGKFFKYPHLVLINSMVIYLNLCSIKNA